MQKSSPIGWAVRPLKNYAKFSGRASRAEFWWFFLFVMIIYFVMVFGVARTIAGFTGPVDPTSFGNVGAVFAVIGLFWLALFIPMLAVQVRRLHDINRSGWWLGAFWLLYLLYIAVAAGAIFSAAGGGNSPPSFAGAAGMGIIGLLFFVYSIVLLVFFCLPGTKGANRFGDDPYGIDVEEVFA